MRRLVQLALLPAVSLLVACPFDNQGTAPPVKPDAPVIGTAVAGNTTAEISFTAPSSDGGAAITGYTVTCSATGATTRTATGSASPITVTNLQNGSTYTCSVTATNSVGVSDPSSGVTVTPAGPPGAPTIGTATPGDGSASIAFSPPASNGGSVITGYFATCMGSGTTTVSSALTLTSPIIVSALFNGVQYNCSVRARNAIGDGPASNQATVTPASLPGAPTSVSAVPGNGQATVSFIEPSNGGSAITTYAVVCTPTSGSVANANGSTSPITVTGMTNGVQYACNVRAANVIGAGPASGNVNVTPVGPPGAPTIGAATPDNASASVAFTAPANNGGSAIIDYTVTCSANGQATRTGTGSSSPIVVASMTNGTAYTCTVTARNSIGSSAASSSVNVTPRTVPGAPTIGTATPGNGQATISFTPGSTGGATPSYTMSCSIGGAGTPVTATGNASPITVTGLTNNSTYVCSVTAANVAGTSVPSGTVSVTPTAPISTNGVMCPYSYSQTNPVALLLSQVTWACATNRTMTSTQVPDYPSKTKFDGNPNEMKVINASISFTLTPSATGTTTLGTHIVGWAKNGVKFEPSTAEQCPAVGQQATTCPQSITSGPWNVEALGQTLFSAGVDSANAHIQPNGAYHYHGMPDKYLSWLSSGGQSTNATPIVQHYLIGFAVDGFPIYAKYGYDDPANSSSTIRVIKSSYRKRLSLPTGRIDTVTVKYGTFTQDWEYVPGLGDLDDCNGRFGKTPDFPNGIYHYYITVEYPYIQRCHKGTVPPTQP